MKNSSTVLARNNGIVKRQRNGNGKPKKVRIAFARRKEEKIFMRYFTHTDPHFL